MTTYVGQYKFEPYVNQTRVRHFANVGEKNGSMHRSL